MTLKREKTQYLQIQKYIFPKMSLNQPFKELKQNISLGIYFLDTRNHYVTFFGIFFKEKQGESQIAS